MDIISKILFEAKWIKRSHILEKNEVQQLFKTTKESIEQCIKQNDFNAGIKKLIIFSEKIKPTLESILEINILRQDEKTKLKNLKHFTKTLLRILEKEKLNNVPQNDFFLPLTIERITDYLNSILRIYTRISDYKNIETIFKHNQFTIFNEYGYKKEEYYEILNVLDKATNEIAKKSFESILYGDVYFTILQDKIAGVYYENNDNIKLNVKTSYRFDNVYTLIHEFGHRYWFKNLSESKKNNYLEQFNQKAKVVSLNDRNIMWEALVKSQFKPNIAVRLLKNENLKNELVARWNDRITRNGFRSKDIIQNQDTQNVIKRMFVGIRDFDLPTNIQQVSVTNYGSGNVLEDFAEIFAHYVLDMPIKEDALKRFLNSIS